MVKEDLLIIGGGPAGYVAALTAARLGSKPLLVERDQIGGTCLNRGCIPTKALLESVETLIRAKRAEEFGVRVSVEGFDVKTMIQRKDAVSSSLRGGLEVLMPDKGVRILRGEAVFSSPHEVSVRLLDGAEERILADKIIIATGSVPMNLPIPGSDLPAFFGSDEALSPKEIPGSVVIVGGGAVGSEFACIYSGLGSEVTLVEMLGTLLPTEDEELGEALKYYMAEQGIRVLTSAKVLSAKPSGDRVTLSVLAGSTTEEITADRVLMAAGRVPATKGFGLDKVGVDLGRRGGIRVNERMETSVGGIYAAGDVTGGIMLAHVAFEEGRVAAENALGGNASMDYSVVPRCVFTHPEVAAVGLSEKEAREKGYSVKVGRYPFANNGRAVAMGKTEGLVKIVADEKTGRILGAGIVGAGATEAIAEVAVAMSAGLGAEALERTIHAHPTLSEAVKEAAGDVFGRAVHK
ncbi:MAG TPA: dihydrolipoyl dehydrogenase [Clostridia bacterium]|nr:dihydrolipoyl dehydrogenase [Clostridia bacterium]